MFNKRIVILCSVLVTLAAASQAAPKVLGNAFAFAVLLGGIPVYMAVRISFFLGVVVYLTAAFLSSSGNMAEALFFLCTSGIIGLFSGTMKKFFYNPIVISASSALFVILMLSGVECLLGVSLFHDPAPESYIEWAVVLFPPLCLYCLLYLKLCILADNLLHRNIELNIY